MEIGRWVGALMLFFRLRISPSPATLLVLLALLVVDWASLGPDRAAADSPPPTVIFLPTVSKAPMTRSDGAQLLASFPGPMSAQNPA
ncbi:MAG: hypothetical protein D6790_18575, partial [Caldilineae bacterium]